MIRLPAKTVRAIAAGRTTQVRVIPGERRQVKRRDADKRDRSAKRWAEPWTPKVGGEEQVRGRDSDGYPVEARVIVTARRKDRLGRVALADAKAMGYGNIDSFRLAWVREHDAAWIDKHKVNLAEALGAGVVMDILCRRFDERHAAEEVWVLEVEAKHDTPRFMGIVNRGNANGEGYVNSPATSIDPHAECVDRITQERLTKQARTVAEQQRASFRRDLEKERARRAGLTSEHLVHLSNRALRHINGAHDREARRAA